MLSYPLLPTFVRHAVDRMKMGNVTEGVSAISCISVMHLQIL